MANPNKERIKQLCSQVINTTFYCQVDNMAQLITSADMAIGAGGTVIWERCFWGLPSITIVIADNQRKTTEVVTGLGATLYIGESSTVNAQKISQFIMKMLDDPIMLSVMSKKAMELVGNPFGDKIGKLLGDMGEAEMTILGDTNYSETLKSKVKDKTAKVGVVGLGYVGLPLAVEKAKVGFSVIGFDRNAVRVDQINRGENYIKDVKDEELKELSAKKVVSATTDFSKLGEVDVIVICVPTPLTITRDPDISYIVNVTSEIAKYLKAGQLITLESTTYPGTTSEVILPTLEAAGLAVGTDFFLAFSPERVDPGNQRYTTKNTSKVVGGITPVCLDVAKVFYEQTILNVVPVSSTAVAELTKVFENTYRAVNIALVNEMMLLCDRMGIDVWEVVEAAGTKPFGIQTFYPGPGVGGHCIPIDPFYLTWKAREYDFHTRFIELAGEINIQASYHVIEKVNKVLNEAKKSLHGAKILVLGVAYKGNIDDYRESPALKIIDLLLKEKAEVHYYDSFVPEIKPHAPYTYSMNSVNLTESVIQDADCVVVITNHSNVDYNYIAQHAKVIVDTRNACKNISVEYRNKIVKI